MRYTITSQQFDFLRREQHIEFEGFYSPEEIATLKSQLDEARNKNATGRDLERGNEPLYKALKFSRLGQAVAALFNKKKLKVAFTQYYPPYQTIDALEDLSSVTELVGGALINLSSEPMPDFPYLPMEQGDVGFYKQEFPIDFSQLELPVLLIAFATEKARYKLQEKDPHTHLLKKLGYGFGDTLAEETHPLIIK
ncbi:MAG: hypothetical protein P0S96_06845 [Simkaniaceae bacterium]|nr:hypothetical protein [Candidatus Sacchlamyda saccharinae]